MRVLDAGEAASWFFSDEVMWRSQEEGDIVGYLWDIHNIMVGHYGITLINHPQNNYKWVV